jgi:hypothetical protein
MVTVFSPDDAGAPPAGAEVALLPLGAVVPLLEGELFELEHAARSAATKAVDTTRRHRRANAEGISDFDAPLVVPLCMRPPFTDRDIGSGFHFHPVPGVYRLPGPVAADPSTGATRGQQFCCSHG